MRQHSIHTCTECPFCTEGGQVTWRPDEGTECEFYCRHPDEIKADEASEPLKVFDAIPNWCAIRKEPVKIVVGR